MKKLSTFLLSTFLLLTGLQADLIGRPAPEINVDQWVHLPESYSEPPSSSTWKGKVTYLYFFQSWCPGCHSSGFPSLKEIHAEFADNPSVKFAAIQTTFEGFSSNTPKAAREIVKRYQLQAIPVGQSGSQGKRSQIMRNFQTRGTPWTVIINQKGEVIFEDFHINPRKGKKIIKKLLKN